MAKPKDLTNRTFGRLTAISITIERWNGKVVWFCKCSCGVGILVPSASLLCGNTRSCGCFKLQVARERGRSSATHGHTKNGRATPEWRLWHAIRNRCQNTNNRDFALYGGRGITVCDRWNDSFENFLADVGFKPAPNLSLDRINNNGNYEPGNVRWATVKQQINNRRPRSEWRKLHL